MDSAVWTWQSYDFVGWGLLPLLVGLLSMALGARGLSTGRPTAELRSGNLFLISTGVWQASIGLVLVSTDPAAGLWWSHTFVLGAASLTPLSLQAADGVAPWIKTPRYALVVIWLMAFVLVIAGLQSDAVVDGLQNHWFGPYPSWGPWVLVLLCHSAAGSFLVMLTYVREFRASPPGSRRRRRMRLILIASVVGLLGYVDYLPGYGLPVPPLGFLGVGAMIVITALATLRYHLMDLSRLSSSTQALERMEDPLLVVERTGEIAYANRAAARTFERPLTSIAGHTVDKVTDRRVRAEQVVAVIDRGGEGPQDIILGENTGFPRYLNVSAAPMENDAGKPVAAVLTFRDHTIREKYRADLELHRVRLEETVVRRTDELAKTVERLQREKAVREHAERTKEQSEARFHELADLLQELIYETDPTGRLTYMNRHGFEATGYAPGDLESGFAGPDLFIPAERAAALADMERRMRGEDDSVREYTVLRKDGSTYPALLRSMPLVHDGKLVGLRGLLLDIGQRKELELQLRQSQRLEAIGQLAGGVAHDFNNLLTVILGTSFFVRKELPAEGRGQTDLATLERAAERASQLTRQLLAFSRKQVLERRHLQLNTVIEELQVMLTRLIGEDIEIRLGLDAALGLTEVDRAQIEQVLLNLAVNARDAMPRGGSMRVTTEQVQLTEQSSLELFEPRAIPPGPYALLTVQDDGVGMSADVRRRAFEPFFTTKGREAGTGLGLSTVYGIVRQHDGAITVESAPGEGSTFRVYLPIAELAGDEERPAVAATAGAGTERILVVEDDDVVRDVVVRHLTQFGYRVREAADAEQVLGEGLDSLADIDLLLTDVVMPGMDGRTLAERVQRAHPTVRVLYMSGYTDDRLHTHRVDAAAAHLLTKPFTQDQLVREVREVLSRDPTPEVGPGGSATG